MWRKVNQRAITEVEEGESKPLKDVQVRWCLTKTLNTQIPLGARMPASLVAVLNETQENPSIKVNFGDKLAGAHQMVLLGCQEVKKVSPPPRSQSWWHPVGAHWPMYMPVCRLILPRPVLPTRWIRS